MAKRQTITYNGDELTRNLKQSAGRGVDAFFPDPSPTPARPEVQTVELPSPHDAGINADESVHARIDARTRADIEAPQQASVDTPVYAHADDDVRTNTDSETPAHAETSDDAGTDASVDPSVDTRMRARTDARTHAPTMEGRIEDAAPITDEVEDVQIDAIQKAIRAKRHLSSFTFRFRANELEELDLAVDELNQDDEHRVSKNDAVRTALNWLLADYKAHKQASVLARVLTDT